MKIRKAGKWPQNPDFEPFKSTLFLSMVEVLRRKRKGNSWETQLSYSSTVMHTSFSKASYLEKQFLQTWLLILHNQGIILPKLCNRHVSEANYFHFLAIFYQLEVYFMRNPAKTKSHFVCHVFINFTLLYLSLVPKGSEKPCCTITEYSQFKNKTDSNQLVQHGFFSLWDPNENISR